MESIFILGCFCIGFVLVGKANTISKYFLPMDRDKSGKQVHILERCLPIDVSLIPAFKWTVGFLYPGIGPLPSVLQRGKGKRLNLGVGNPPASGKSVHAIRNDEGSSSRHRSVDEVLSGRGRDVPCSEIGGCRRVMSG